jgi:hypothetical protein
LVKVGQIGRANAAVLWIGANIPDLQKKVRAVLLEDCKEGIGARWIPNTLISCFREKSDCGETPSLSAR